MNGKTAAENGAKAVSEIFDRISNLKKLIFREPSTEKTVLVIVDVINGFIREGAMADGRIESIIGPVRQLLIHCVSSGIPAVAFADCHSEGCEEFSTFPPHCIKGGSECEVVGEIKETGGYTLIEKNSVNGFHEPEFASFLKRNPERTDYIVCGDCTDVCVMNFCLCLKSYFDSRNIKSSVTVPINATETYSGPGHDGDFMKLISLEIMRNAGIKIVGGVEFD